MGLNDFMQRAYKQSAVYWGNSRNNGSGGYIFDDPIELSPDNNNGVRWENRIELGGRVFDKLGDILSCNAIVFLNQDVQEQGYLMLGTLDDLDSDSTINPKLIEGAYEIKRFDKTPAIGSATDFYRRAYLGYKV
jgi:hypothetical protein